MALECALEIGGLLAEARTHFVGDERGFLKWVRAEFGYRRRHVFNLLKLAEEVQRVALPPGSSIRQALAALALPTGDATDPEPVAPPDWTDEERTLLERLKAGEATVINLHRHKALEQWARANDVFVRIDRQSDWGNPFELEKDGDRATVIENYREHYLPFKPSLLMQIGDLEHKALGCWCAPDPCHGDVLVEELKFLLIQESMPSTAGILVDLLRESSDR